MRLSATFRRAHIALQHSNITNDLSHAAAAGGIPFSLKALDGWFALSEAGEWAGRRPMRPIDALAARPLRA